MALRSGDPLLLEITQHPLFQQTAQNQAHQLRARRVNQLVMLVAAATFFTIAGLLALQIAVPPALFFTLAALGPTLALLALVTWVALQRLNPLAVLQFTNSTKNTRHAALQAEIAAKHAEHRQQAEQQLNFQQQLAALNETLREGYTEEAFLKRAIFALKNVLQPDVNQPFLMDVWQEQMRQNETEIVKLNYQKQNLQTDLTRLHTHILAKKTKADELQERFQTLQESIEQLEATIPTLRVEYGEFFTTHAELTTVHVPTKITLDRDFISIYQARKGDLKQEELTFLLIHSSYEALNTIFQDYVETLPFSIEFLAQAIRRIDNPQEKESILRHLATALQDGDWFTSRKKRVVQILEELGSPDLLFYFITFANCNERTEGNSEDLDQYLDTGDYFEYGTTLDKSLWVLGALNSRAVFELWYRQIPAYEHPRLKRALNGSLRGFFDAIQKESIPIVSLLSSASVVLPPDMPPIRQPVALHTQAVERIISISRSRNDQAKQALDLNRYNLPTDLYLHFPPSFLLDIDYSTTSSENLAILLDHAPKISCYDLMRMKKSDGKTLIFGHDPVKIGALLNALPRMRRLDKQDLIRGSLTVRLAGYAFGVQIDSAPPLPVEHKTLFLQLITDHPVDRDLLICLLKACIYTEDRWIRNGLYCVFQYCLSSQCDIEEYFPEFSTPHALTYLNHFLNVIAAPHDLRIKFKNLAAGLTS